MARRGSSYVSTMVAGAAMARGGAALTVLDFEDAMASSKPGDSIDSEQFTVGGATFTLRVNPNGYNKESEGQLSLLLWNKNPGDVKVDYIKMTAGRESKDAKKATVKNGSGYGWLKWCTQEEAKDLLRLGVLEATVEVGMAGKKMVISKEHPATPAKAETGSWVLGNLYRDSMDDTDFTLICEGVEIPIHRQVLKGASPFFKSLLKPENPESQKGESNLHCSAEVGRQLVRYVYTNEVDEAVFDANLATFLQLADMYLVEQLKARTEQRMGQILNRENMVQFTIAGDKFNGHTIKEAAKQFVLVNLGWLREQEGWRDAFQGNMDLLVDILLST